MAQFDPIAAKSGILTVLGTDTLRDDRVAVAGLDTTTNSLVSGDVCQVDSVALRMKKASSNSVSPIVGIYDGVSSSVVRRGVVAATFISGLTLANGDVVYLSSTDGALTNVKPTAGVIHEVGVVVDVSGSRVLLQQKPCVDTGVAGPLTRLLIAGSNTASLRVDAYNLVTGTWERLADYPTQKFAGVANSVAPNEITLLPASRKLAWPTCYPGNPGWPDTGQLTVYDIATNTWSAFNAHAYWNSIGQGGLTGLGRYIIPNGTAGQNPSLYDPTTHSLVAAAGLLERCSIPSCVTLADGRVAYVAPGYDGNNVRLFTDNGAAGSWATAAATANTHNNCLLIRLRDNRIMAIGGWATTSCEMNTPTCDTAWGLDTPIPSGSTGQFPAGCLLPDGRVVVINGDNARILIYTPGAWSPGEAPAAHPGSWAVSARTLPYAYRVSSVLYSAASGTGKVYIIFRPSGDTTNGIQVYDPAADTLSVLVPPTWEQRYALGCIF